MGWGNTTATSKMMMIKSVDYCYGAQQRHDNKNRKGQQNNKARWRHMSKSGRNLPDWAACDVSCITRASCCRSDMGARDGGRGGPREPFGREENGISKT